MTDALPNDHTWSVLVFDMARTGEPDGERRVPGFDSIDKARAYAEARMRSSVEELRSEDASPDAIRRMWFIYGEDCIVLGEPRGESPLDLYIAVPATPAECDWAALTPRLKRFHCVLMIDNAEGQTAWAGGRFYRYRRSTPATLFALFKADAATSMKERGYADTVPVSIHVAHHFELLDPPRPNREDRRPMKRWHIAIEFVCHDVKFGGSNAGVFEWPEEPSGNALFEMNRLLMGDMLSIRGDGPGYADYSEVLSCKITETTDAPDYPLEPAETVVPPEPAAG